VVGDLLQPTHLLFVLIVALLVLGPKRLPEVGRALGRGLRDFRSAINGDETVGPTIPAAEPPLSTGDSTQAPVSTEQPSPTPPSTEQPSPVPPEKTASAEETAAEGTAPTEVQAPHEHPEPVASSASADSNT
jgi:sec-independent protein translocase protein TatA